MPYKDPEKAKQKAKEYRNNLSEEQKEQKRLYDREYKRKNPRQMTEEQKQKRKEYMQQYNEKKKLERKEFYKIHNQKPEVKKARKINEWKRRGLITENYDLIYDKWLNTTNCESCGCDLQYGVFGGNQSNTKCMDHCHTTGEFRHIICHRCNSQRR